MQYAPIVTFYIIAALICFTSMYLAVKQLNCVVSLMIMGCWSALCAAETAAVSLDRKLIIIHVEYVAYTMLLPSWIQWMLEYVTRRPQGRHPLVYAAYGLFAGF
ncbi:MAG TPA: hypothetical protein PKE04_06310, partial [Clostridia bacterium]|nr:hypothetical protein [Clostridia bacterium]